LQPPEWPVNGKERAYKAAAFCRKRAGDAKAEQSVIGMKRADKAQGKDQDPEQAAIEKEQVEKAPEVNYMKEGSLKDMGTNQTSEQLVKVNVERAPECDNVKEGIGKAMGNGKKIGDAKDVGKGQLAGQPGNGKDRSDKSQGKDQDPEQAATEKEQVEKAPELEYRKEGSPKDMGTNQISEQPVIVNVEKALECDSVKEGILKAMGKGLMSEQPVIVNVPTQAALVVEGVKADCTGLPGKGQRTEWPAHATEHTDKASAVCRQKDSCSAKEHLDQAPADDFAKHCNTKVRGRGQSLEQPALAREHAVKAPGMDSVKDFRDEAQRPLDQLQYGDSFCMVSDGLRLAEVSRAHLRLAIHLWSPSMRTWSEDLLMEAVPKWN